MIVYRDATGKGRVPAHMTGSTQRGVECCVCESYVFPDTTNADWLDIEDGFQVAVVDGIGDTDSLLYGDESELVLSDGTRAPRLWVCDIRGHVWHIPAMLNSDGIPVVQASWAIGESGKWERKLSPVQASLLDMAAQCYEMLTSGTAHEMPMDAMAEWASTILCAAYRLTPMTIGRIGILDDRLAPAILWACAGVTPETLEQ